MWGGSLFTGQGWKFLQCPHGLHGHCIGGESTNSPVCLCLHFPIGTEKGNFVTSRWGCKSSLPCSLLTPQEWRSSLPPSRKESPSLLCGPLWHHPWSGEHPVSWGWTYPLTLSLCWKGWRWSCRFSVYFGSNVETDWKFFVLLICPLAILCR